MNVTYTRVPNYILENITRFNLSARELKILLAVIRKTYGYQKESDELSLGRLAKLTGCDRSYIGKSVNSLIERKILNEVDKPQFVSGRTLAMNENSNEWINERPTVVKTTTPTVVKNTTPTVVSITTPTYIKENKKENYKRNNYYKEKRRKPSYDLELFKEMLHKLD